MYRRPNERAADQSCGCSTGPRLGARCWFGKLGFPEARLPAALRARLETPRLPTEAPRLTPRLETPRLMPRLPGTETPRLAPRLPSSRSTLACAAPTKHSMSVASLAKSRQPATHAADYTNCTYVYTVIENFCVFHNPSPTEQTRP